MIAVRLCIALILGTVAASASAEGLVSVADPDSLVAPVEVEAADVYLDLGGTIGVSLVDSVGQRLLFCINRRLQWDRPEPAVRDTTIGRLLIGARYPTAKALVLVPEGGREERAILDLLRAFLDRHHSPDEQLELRRHAETGMYVPPELEPPLENGIRAMTVTHAIRILEKRCEPPN